ncbi:FAD-containing monooxygenase EthA [Tolypocladium capitatum]|uniref:FAD-containing monooxygenase EthA n=1 Tax=Tolypocladium capitatum TaxID=45235 RepID=A0A2K3QL77_9HYPO|nr:FAD-containing monooxygenase EthA [Tolypocladium capitatum]
MGDIAEHHDLLVLGAGLSGINTAHVLREQLPHRKVTILEGRSVIGGTWNFFKYPGFRSDSNMTVFGFKWHPWPHDHKIASGPEIASYLEDAARKDGIMDHIRLRHKVTHCEWRDEDQFWSLTVDAEGTERVFAANFVFLCTGYYSFDRALDAVIPGLDSFAGTVAHPQWWPRDFDYADKKVVIVGSGATAVTMLPVIAETAAQVTMLQRSPSYVISMPSKLAAEKLLRAVLPRSWSDWFCWWKDLGLETALTRFLIYFPNASRRALTWLAKKQLPADVDVNVHFNPRYNPTQQRLCMCPDGDFFKALHRDNSRIVTDVVETVTPDGVLLKSGRKLDADVIITATGLYFEIMNGMQPVVNGKPIDGGAHYTWRGGMLEALPNMGYVFGYVVQSWTPGADTMAKLLVKVIKRMEDKKATKVVPTLVRYEGMPRNLAVDVNSSYILRAADRIPKVTGEDPWYGRTHWLRDVWALWFGSVDEGLAYSAVEGKKDI